MARPKKAAPAEPVEIGDELEPAAEKPKRSKSVAVFTYDGSARDHAVTPGVHAIGRDGRPIKRQYVRPARTEYFGIDEYNLWGFKFPAGEPVPVSATDAHFRKHATTLHAMVQKATALGCFAIDCDPSLLEPLPAKRRRAR